MRICHALILGIALSTTSLLAQRDITVEELDTAYRHWQANVEFRSTCTYIEGVAPNHEAVFTKQQGVNVTANAMGVFYKMGSMSRQSRFFKDKPIIVGNEKKAGQVLLKVRHSPQDEVYDESFSLRYNPKWNNFNDTATYAARAAIPVEPGRRACFSSESWLNPLNPMPGCFAGFPGTMEGARAVKDYEVKPLDDEHIVMTGEAPEPKGGTNKIEIEWWLGGAGPVISRVYRTYINEKGTVETRAESRLTGFQKCPGGHVARKVTVALTAGNGPTAVRIWESRDLGAERPKLTDFEIVVPASTKVVGLNNPPPPGKPRRLSLFGDIRQEITIGSKVIEKRP